MVVTTNDKTKATTSTKKIRGTQTSRWETQTSPIFSLELHVKWAKWTKLEEIAVAPGRLSQREHSHRHGHWPVA